jgi:hypothetical protein
MACTYFGGSTAKFTSDISRLGVVRDEQSSELFIIPGVSDIVFAANGSDVAYDVMRGFGYEGKGLPKPLVRNLEKPVMVDGWHGGLRQAVNVEFLASCKLLDMHSYTKALQSNPSPIALSIACRQARTTLKPDYPRTRKGGLTLWDFIEELVYVDLSLIEEGSHRLCFQTQSYLVEEIDNYGTKDLWVEFVDKFGMRFSKDAYLARGPFTLLDLNYFERMGLLKVSSVEIFNAFMSMPEAFQRAVREALGYQVVDLHTTELPSGLLDD